MSNDVLKTKRIKDWANAALSKAIFKVGNFLPLDGNDGSLKIPAEFLETLQNLSVTKDSEFSFAIVDQSNHFIFGVRNDGSIEWQKGVPSRIKEILDGIGLVLDDHSAELLNKVDKVTGKSLVNSIFANGIEISSNDEFSFALLDDFGHFLFGIRKDGSIEWQKGVPGILGKLFDSKADKVLGKSLIDEKYGNSAGSISYNEFLYILKDSQNRIIAAVRQDGSIYTGLPIEGLNAKQNSEPGKTVIDEKFSSASSHKKDTEYVYAITDKNGFLLLGIKNDGSFESQGLRDMIIGGGNVVATTDYVDEKVDSEKQRAQAVEDELAQAISEIEPVIVQGGENTPDNVFLTTGDNDAITLKNKSASSYGYGIFNIKPSDPASSVFSQTRTIYNIRFPLNLGGAEINLPQDVILNFCGGFVYNGTLVGNHTKANFTPACIGPDIVVSGTWNIPYISSNILTEPGGVNALKILCNFLSDESFNILHIVPGNYVFTPTGNADKLITLKSNTKLIIDGIVEITPNGYPNYYIVRLENVKNVEITGCGKIVGDADEHDYITTQSTHEWGMCIACSGSENILIHDITLENATGDGIYISETSTKEPKQVCIERCSISHCGRQGISVTAGEQIKIRGCKIDDIYRTLPRAAVDIEANSGHHISGVDVSDLIISRCRGLMAIHSDCVMFTKIKALNCGTLFYCEDTKIANFSEVFSNSNIPSSDFVIATNDCEKILFNEVNFENEENFVVDLNNIKINHLCDFGSAQITGNPVEASTKYLNGKFVQFNGINWVNFDGTLTN